MRLFLLTGMLPRRFPLHLIDRNSMKPSKMGKNKSSIKSDPSRTYSSSLESAIADDGHIEGMETEGKEALDWLISVFPSCSFEQIDSVYKETGRDAYTAAGILAAELVDPRESLKFTGKKRNARKYKRIAASTGIVSDIIGKDYSKPASDFCGGRRGCGGPMEANKQVVYACYNEDAEEFLYSMLGDDSELGMGAVRDVLSQCGYNLEKALDALLDINKLSNNQFKESFGADQSVVISSVQRKGAVRNSEIRLDMLNKDFSKNAPKLLHLTDNPSVSTYHLSAKEQDILHYEGSGCRDYLKVPLSTKKQAPLQSEMENHDLQQKILEFLFHIPEAPCAVSRMNWKKLLKQVEPFGRGLEFDNEGAVELSPASRVGGEDDYHVLRTVAKKNWDTMRSCYHKATQAYTRGERTYASLLSEEGKFYKKLACEADEKASQEIFSARNIRIKNTVTIDLHGQHVKQAIKLLKLHLLMFAYIPSVHCLRVITGCGGDGVGLGKLKAMALHLVQEEGIKCKEENSGTLLIFLEGKRSFTFMESEADSDES